jgi:hypothetical protein
MRVRRVRRVRWIVRDVRAVRIRNGVRIIRRLRTVLLFIMINV